MNKLIDVTLLTHGVVRSVGVRDGGAARGACAGGLVVRHGADQDAVRCGAPGILRAGQDRGAEPGSAGRDRGGDPMTPSELRRAAEAAEERRDWRTAATLWREVAYALYALDLEGRAERQHAKTYNLRRGLFLAEQGLRELLGYHGARPVTPGMSRNNADWLMQLAEVRDELREQLKAHFLSAHAEAVREHLDTDGGG